MVSGTLALCRYSVIYMNMMPDSGPGMGRSPVEWGKILFVRLSVRPSTLQRPEPDLGRPKPGSGLWRADGRTDRRTNGIFPHSTGLRPLSGLLPCITFM